MTAWVVRGRGRMQWGCESEGVGCAAKMVTGTIRVRVETTPYDAVR